MAQSRTTSAFQNDRKAAPKVPPTLKEQVQVGEILVILLGEGDTQVMIRLTKLPSNDFKEERFDYFAFVPMLKGGVN